ncbi:MAG: CocE/NonD family hydrolase, partial [Planctomycetota bacterium]|nr:CocE/NonD family hydrolase [Planctomycetota bacterium]
SQIADGSGTTIMVDGPALELRFEVASPDGDEASASLVFEAGPARLTELDPITLILQRRARVREVAGAARHDGVLRIPGGGSLPITIVLANVEGSPAGLIDIPAQGVQGLLMSPGVVPEPTVDDSLESHPDVRVWSIPVPQPATLLVRPDGDSWIGEFRQGSFRLPVRFERAASDVTLSPRRPQTPVPPLPYSEIEVDIGTAAGHRLAGTLLIPDSIAPETGFPAVVMITGSGPQNRDEELLGHRPFEVLADHLARRGIASLRYDDRGVAASTGEFTTATSHDFADDAAWVLAHLRGRSELDPDRCGLLGHSEGGMVAALVAAGLAPNVSDAEPSFVVSLAGTGVDGGVVMNDQMQRIYRARGIGAKDVALVAEAHASLMDLVREDAANEEELIESVRRLQDLQFAIMEASVGDDERSGLDLAALGQLRTPWMESFIRLDPADAWRRVGVPVLAINGTLDLQVWHDLNLDAIDAAVTAGGGRVDIVRLEGLNHLFQPTGTGLPEEYGAIDLTMDVAAMECILNWILRNPTARTRESSEER